MGHDGTKVILPCSPAFFPLPQSPSSWGNYDKKQFIQDCEFHHVPYPFGSEHINIKKEFSASLGVSKGFGMAKALQHLGIELQGTHHRGIDDARNIASIYRRIKTQKVS